MNQCPQNPCCSPFDASYEEATHFFQARNTPFEIRRGNPKAWRIRAKLAVRGTKDEPLIGLFKEGSHEVYEIPQCAAHHPLINQAQNLVKSWMITNQITPYDEKTGQGHIRYLQFIVERTSERVQVSFVLNISCDLPIKSLIENAPTHFWHSIWTNLNSSLSNTIFSEDWRCLYGEKWIVEEICGYPGCYLPGSFGQANLEMFEQLIYCIKDQLPLNQRLVEFYAGIGIIGIALAEKTQSVLLNEINPSSKLCFDEIVYRLPETIRQKLSYQLASAQNQLSLIDQGDIILVDPPRKGLSPSFLKALNNSTVPHTLIYISCDFNSFMRDTQALQSHWQLKKAQGYLFFPGTNHLETLCFFSRK